MTDNLECCSYCRISLCRNLSHLFLTSRWGSGPGRWKFQGESAISLNHIEDPSYSVVPYQSCGPWRWWFGHGQICLLDLCPVKLLSQSFFIWIGMGRGSCTFSTGWRFSTPPLAHSVTSFFREKCTPLSQFILCYAGWVYECLFHIFLSMILALITCLHSDSFCAQQTFFSSLWSVWGW